MAQTISAAASRRVCSAVVVLLATALLLSGVGGARAEAAIKGFRITYEIERLKGDVAESNPSRGAFLRLWILKLSATGVVRLEEDGRIEGKLAYRITPPSWVDQSCEGNIVWCARGSGSYRVTGSFSGNILTLTPQDLSEISFTWSPLHGPLHFSHASASSSFPVGWLNLKVPLKDGKYESSKIDRYTGAFRDGDWVSTNYRVTTKIEPVEKVPEGDLSLIAEKDLVAGAPVPGSGQRYDTNKLTLTLPKHPKLLAAQKAGKKIWVTVETKSGGRLFEQEPYSTGSKGKRELWFRQMQPGEQKVFYYAWTSDGPTSPVEETVRAYIQDPTDTGLEGTVSFGVGIDLKITSVSRASDWKPRLLTREPLKIEVVDGFGRGDASSVVQKLKVMPVLRIKQTGYERAAFLGFAVDWFGYDIFNIGEYFSAMTYSLDAADPKQRPSRIEGSEYAWPVTAGGTLEGSGDRQYPYLFFHGVGLHKYEIDIPSLRLGYADSAQPVGKSTPQFQNPVSGPYKFEVEVTDIPETAGLLGVLFTCVGAAKDTLGLQTEPFETLTKFKKLKFIWTVLGCLKASGAYVASLLPVREGIELNVAAQTARQMTDAPLDGLSDAELKTLRQTPLAEETRRAQEVQAIVKGMDDTQLVLISKKGLADVTVESAADGALKEGPSKFDPRLLMSEQEADRQRVKSDYGPAKRLQSGANFIVVPARLGEKLTLKLKGTGADSSLFVVSAKGIEKVTYPADGQEADFALGPGGKITQESGPRGVITQVQPLDLGAAPEIPVVSSAADKKDETEEPTPPEPSSSEPSSPEPPVPAQNAEPAKPPVEPPVEPEVGGQCSYDSYPGSCTITAVTATTASAAQAKTGGGAGYEGREVKFAFTSRAPIASAAGQKAMREQHELRLKNSWYPGPRFIAKYAVAPGKSFSCTMRVRTSGACTPIAFDFPAIDTGDYSERR